MLATMRAAVRDLAIHRGIGPDAAVGMVTADPHATMSSLARELDATKAMESDRTAPVILRNLLGDGMTVLAESVEADDGLIISVSSDDPRQEMPPDGDVASIITMSGSFAKNGRQSEYFAIIKDICDYLNKPLFLLAGHYFNSGNV